MKKKILIFILCVILNKAAAPSPYSVPKVNPVNLRPGIQTGTNTQKLQDHSLQKIKGFVKPAKDSATLNNLVKGAIKDISNSKNAAEKDNNLNVTGVELIKEECLNVSKTLYADEIVSINDTNSTNSFNTTSRNVKEESNVKKKFNMADFNKKVQRNDVKPKNIPIIKPKMPVNDAQSRNFEIPPAMIPIFKPNPNIVRNQAISANIESVPEATRSNIPVQDQPLPTETTTNPDEIKQIPIEQTPKFIMKFIPNKIPFNIPCHKASDVLDDLPATPEEYLKTPKSVSEPTSTDVKNDLQNQRSIELSEEIAIDDSVAIVFKPKNISLLNVYGDMLKKVTLTVLVPYHISKLGAT